MLLKMRLLVTDMIFVGEEAAEIRKSNQGFHFLKACTGKPEFYVQGAGKPNGVSRNLSNGSSRNRDLYVSMIEHSQKSRRIKSPRGDDNSSGLLGLLAPATSLGEHLSPCDQGLACQRCEDCHPPVVLTSVSNIGGFYPTW